jgi:V8-like Glu-specific endopeptidase
MFKSVTGWITGRKPESDYGCVVLPQGAFGGRNLGSFGFAAFDTQAILAQPAVLAGYPGDKPFAELWGMARRIKSASTKTLVYDIDTVGGQSGAPVYIKRNGQRYVIGIHNYGAGSGNSATRVTREVFDRLTAWSKL